MGLFGSIFESVINEIRAEDAYNRFYSSMPREDFDAITGGEENIDKFIQFFLNCVRDGKSTTIEATNALKLYSRADQLVKNKIKSKVVNGEYEDADDVISDAKYLSNGGAVLSRKKFAKEGYIKLGESERWICTCTTNYCANNHYYGSSHWCTASDRMGRYDGYGYFKSYSLNNSCALVQYKWKGKVIDSNTNNPSLPENLFDEHEGFIGDEIPRQYSMFQVQVNSEGYIGQLCDFMDYSLYSSGLKKYVGLDMFNILNDTEKIEVCINKTKEQNEIEEPYQEAIYESLKKKKEKRERELNEKKIRLQAQCREANDRKIEFIRKQWEELSKIIERGDFDIIKKMWKRDITDHGYDLNEEVIKETHYCRLTRQNNIDDTHYIVNVTPIIGNRKVVERIQLNNGLEDVVINEEFRTSLAVDVGLALVIELPLGGDLRVIKKFGPYNEKVYVYNINGYGTDYSTSERFFEITTDTYSVSLAYDSKTNTAFDLRFLDTTVLGLGENRFIFINGDGDGAFRDFFIFNGDTKELEKPDDGTKCYKMYYTTGIGLVNDNWDYQLVYCPGYNILGKKMSCLSPIDEFTRLSEDEDKFYVSFSRDTAPVNMYSSNAEDFVFGIFGTDTWIEGGECMLRYRVKNKLRRTTSTRRTTLMRLVCKRDGSYVKFVDEGDINEIPCDKYGRTEKDILGNKNFKDWQNAGGHSPEAKAQMDAMWADRNAKDKDGSEAMAAWNDDDVRRDLGIPQTTTIKNLPDDNRFVSQKMRDAMKDPRWKGTIGIKDPEGFLGYIGGYKKPSDQRPNPFYRIGVDGKPLDQPWYDEDEVPARFAEYEDEPELAEAVNKIKSLFNRMGLFED